ncbi:helix-turn-helix domain-containing protein [Streptococcus hillyeri]|uniref:helix-turn-helix domain-containing protein n=1 Tax=Streptococcus hillyeri TaxID=2282420 RepID=UPI0034E26C5A
MLNGFGQKVRDLREGLHITREEFCGDETELSIRQLARIESGQSIPTLAKVEYIAQQLGVTVGSLTDGENLELPKRYKELKYLILRTPTYLDEERLKVREEQFDEIFEEYYDKLPEAEQVLVDIVQARFEVFNSGNKEFGSSILEDYFEQVKKKKFYGINDMALIDLYLICVLVENFDVEFYDEVTYNQFIQNLRNQGSYLNVEDLFFLNKIYLIICSVLVKKGDYAQLEDYLDELYHLILKSQDFQRMPLYYMYRWKYSLSYLDDKNSAEEFYAHAILFAEMTSDLYLVKKLKDEWKKNIGEEM